MFLLYMLYMFYSSPVSTEQIKFPKGDVNAAFSVQKFGGQALLDRYNLYHPFRFTFLNLYGRLFLLSLEGNAFVELSSDGQVLAEYLGPTGAGPGDFSLPRVVLPYKTGFAILNPKNGQFVVLDKDLKFVENIHTNFSGRRAYLHQGVPLVFLMGGQNIFGQVNPETLQLEQFAFKRRQSADRTKVSSMAFTSGFLFYYKSRLSDEQNFPLIEVYAYNRDLKNMEKARPTRVLASPELPDLLSESPRKGYLGYIANVQGFKDFLVLENVIADRKTEVRVYDIFNMKGHFLERIVSELAMIGSPMAKDIYFLGGDVIYKLVDLELKDNPSSL